MVLSNVVLTKNHYMYSRGNDGGIVSSVVREGNYFGTSKGMEQEAFRITLEELRNSSLLGQLERIVTDGDAGLAALLRKEEDTRHVQLAGDAGDAKKNFHKALNELFGQTDKYKGFAYRISTFWMRCLKRMMDIQLKLLSSGRNILMDCGNMQSLITLRNVVATIVLVMSFMDEENMIFLNLRSVIERRLWLLSSC
jgi:hypothetical protein